MSAAYARAAAAYQQTSVQSSSPLELVVMLYDGALRHLGAAREGMLRKDLVARRDGISRALAILSELQSTLNFTEGGELARSLDSLYTYVTGRVVEANVRSDVAGIQEAEKLLRSLRDGWAQAASAAGGGVLVK